MVSGRAWGSAQEAGDPRVETDGVAADDTDSTPGPNEGEHVTVTERGAARAGDLAESS